MIEINGEKKIKKIYTLSEVNLILTIKSNSIILKIKRKLQERVNKRNIKY